MSETSTVTSPLIKAIRSLPYCWATRLQSGTARGGKMRLCEEGTPDILAFVAGTALLVETKVPGGRLSPAQLETHARLRRAGARVEVVTSVAEGIATVRSILEGKA